MIKKNTEQLINDLSNESPAFRKPFKPIYTFLKWVIFTLAYIIVLTQFLHLRPDIRIAIQDPFFLIEITLLFFLILFSAYSCSFLSLPDFSQKKLVFTLPLIPLLGLIAYLLFAYSENGNTYTMAGHEGIMCTSCIIFSSLIPASFFFLEVRKAAPTKLYHLSLFTLLYAVSLGAFTLRLSEMVDSFEHLILWHYGPMLAFACVGAFFCKKIIKW